MKFNINTNTLEDVERIVPELNPSERGRYYSIICPYCGKKEAFLYKGKQIIVCSRKNKCGKIIDLYKYLREIKGINDKEIIKLVFEDTEDYIEVIDIIKNKIEVPEGLKFFDLNKKSIIQNRFLSYLNKRKIDPSVIEELGYVYNGDYRYNDTIFVPFFEDGEMVYYQTRGIQRKKYMNLGIDAKGVVYNIDKIDEDKNVFIFEGIFDALSLKGEDSIATTMLTSKLSVEKAIKIIDKYPKSITIVPDLDLAGVYGLNKSLNVLKERLPTNGEIKIYYYILDMNRFIKIKELIETKGLKLQEKIDIYDSWKLSGVKDFNDFVINGGSEKIELEDRIEFFGNQSKNEDYLFKELKNKFSNSWI